MVKAVTQAMRDTIAQDMAIKAQPRLIAEWEYNRFFAPTVTVTPDQSTADDDWVASYDLSSVVLPFRPTAGIARMRSDGGVVPLTGVYRDPGTTRFYPTPDDPLYSYFASVQRSQLAPAAAGDGYEFDTPIKVSAVYPQQIATNKIVIGFETGYSTPSSFSIQVSADGTSWQTIFSNPDIAPDGTVTIWHSNTAGSGWGGAGWDVTPVYDSPVAIQGVRVVVYAMDAPYSHADVLQISPRLENDLTPYLIKYSVGMSQDQPSFIAPLGKASSNTASVTLSNIDGRFNNDNTNSLYYDMIEKKVRFTLDLGIDTSGHGGTGYEYVREFTMWTDNWGAGDNSTIDVDLKDSSVILQEQTMPSMFLQNTTVGQIVWQTLDTIGMTNYRYTRSDPDYGIVIPFYWPSDTAEASNPRWGRLRVSTTTPPTTTIWDELSAIAESTQTGLYFDEYDVLQIKSRQQMYNTGKLPDYNLDAVKNGQKLPDIISTQTDYSLSTNRVEITYKPCAFSDDQNGFPKMETVWSPGSDAAASTSIVPVDTLDTSSGSDVSLRATSMTKDLLVGGTDLWIHQEDAGYWLYESDVNIEGEMLHYKGKEYGYYDATGNLVTQICYDNADQAALDALNEDLSFKNAYTGRLLVTERGLYGSTVGDHHVQSASSYKSMLTSWNHSGGNSNLGYHDWTVANDGYISQTAPITSATPNYNNLCYVRMHNQAVIPQEPVNPMTDQPGVNPSTVWYGGRIRWQGNAENFADASAGANWRIGGFFIAGDDNGNGYYLEICPTTEIDGWEKRQWRNEICLMALPASGNEFQVNGTNAADKDASNNPIGNKGFQASIMEDTWYQVDISFNQTDISGNTHITVFLNGVYAADWLIPPGSKPAYTNAWRFGTYVRGPAVPMDIDYLYAIGQDDTNPFNDPDEDSFLSIAYGGYQSRFLRTNIMYACANPSQTWPGGGTYYPDALNNLYLVYDEFGPVVHEVRTFDVSFSDQYIPVASSYLLFDNTDQVECLSYYADASGATFVLANASRQLAVVNGSDAITYGSDNSITRTLAIYGRVVYTAQNDSTKIVGNDDMIRRQGLVRTQFTSRYIQTDEMAGVIGDWVLSLWSMGVDQVSADLFGNPLLQIGDLVTVSFPSKGMTPATHQYFVTSIKGSFEKGYKTSVVLRRARTL